MADLTGRTPLHLAADAGNLDVARRLVGAGADVNAKDGEGRTPLYLATRQRHDDLAKFLRDSGAVE